MLSRLVVGSSAMMKVRPQRDDHGDQRPLQHAAARADADRGEHALGLRECRHPRSQRTSSAPISRRRRRPISTAALAMRSRCQPTVLAGLKAPAGFWKIMASWPPRQARNSASAPGANRLAAKAMASAATARCRAEAAAATVMLTVLPEPDSPITPSTSPRRIEKLDAAHGLHLAVADRGMRTLQIAASRRGQRRRHSRDLSRRRGSMRSRMPSPRRLRPSSAIEMQQPDRVSTQGPR